MTAPTDDPLVIAFYLPQFHPVPENDAWWGDGFTEWRNVVRGTPQFQGHYQPHLPADLGFYDLRLPEARVAQADLAMRHGVSAFCYYHYWFNGRQILERPFDEVLASYSPDFPFCLAWANEPWTRNWDGGSEEVLIEQQYSDADHDRHIEWLLSAFKDARYVRIGGRPLFMIYNPLSIPDLPKVLDGWRARCDTAGVGIPIFGCFETFGNFERDPQELGCDATAEFLPHGIERFVNRTVSGEQFAADNTVIDYQELVDGHMQSPARTWPHFRTILPGWDNTPRRKNGWSIVLTGSTPELFGRWASASLRRARDESAPLVFVNAWNEWAEGAHLEPDLKFGRAYLEALATARGVDPEAELQPSGRDSGPESQPTGGAIPSAPQIGRLLLDKLRLERRAADAERRLIASYEARLADSGATKIADVVAGLTSLQASVSELSGRIDGAAEAAVTAAAASVSAAAASTAAAAASAEALAAASQRRTSLAGRLVRARRILRKDRRPGFRYLPKDHDLLDEP